MNTLKALKKAAKAHKKQEGTDYLRPGYHAIEREFKELCTPDLILKLIALVREANNLSTSDGARDDLGQWDKFHDLYRSIDK